MCKVGARACPPKPDGIRGVARSAGRGPAAHRVRSASRAATTSPGPGVARPGPRDGGPGLSTSRPRVAALTRYAFAFGFAPPGTRFAGFIARESCS